MKKIFIPIVFLLSFSCRQHAPKIMVDDISVAGKWRLCSIIYTSKQTSFNVCPEMIFVKNHSGYIKRSDPILLYFNWRINDGKLSINHTINKDKDNIIDDGTYKISHFNGKGFQGMDLVDTLQHVTYRLGKED